MRGSHLGRVAKEAEPEAAAFELHLQGRAPGHGDPAPVVSGEHAGDSFVPVLRTARAARLCLVSSASVPRRPPAGPAGKLPRPSSQTPPPETTPGLGRARPSPPPPPPKARPVAPAPGRPAGLADSHSTRHLASTAGAHHPFRPGSRRLTWARGGSREAPPHLPPPPGTPDSLRAENPLAPGIAARHTSALAGPRYRAQSHP